MKTTVQLSDFRDAFRAYDRMENFSYEGLEVLFDFLEELEQDTGEEMELDVIALCCDFSEDSYEAIAENYNIDLSDFDDDDDEGRKDAVLEYLNDNTMVVGETSTSIIYQAF